MFTLFFSNIFFCFQSFATLSDSLESMVKRVRFNREQWIRLAEEGSHKFDDTLETTVTKLNNQDTSRESISSPSSAISSSSPDNHHEELKFSSDTDDKNLLLPSSQNERIRTPEENPIVGVLGNDRTKAIVNRRENKHSHDI